MLRKIYKLSETTIFRTVLFSRKLPIPVLNEFLGSLPEFESETGTELKFVDESIPSIRRINAIHATAVTCLCSASTEKVGRHRQNLHHRIIASFLPKAMDQNVDKIIIYYTTLGN